MVFNSVAFVYYFLPLVLAVFYLLNKHTRAQNIWLLVASFFFYGWCNIDFLVFLLVFGIVNYCFAGLIFRCIGNGQGKPAKAVMIAGVLANVLCLYVVKYLNFSIRTVNAFVHTAIPQITNLILPLGISFLVFTMISYLVDIYRQRVVTLSDPVDFFLYLSFFPKISQGPIARCEHMVSELTERKINLDSFSTGLRRFCFGLAKKVLIADTLGASVDLVYSSLYGGIPMSAAWAGILCYTFQIYFDFSGYTDMAIGIGNMFGFSLPENFNSPYLSRSVSEFWRRWHMTLGSWFREYVYIPLGGNRKGSARTIFNLAVVWLLTGIWHGASYNFILWGIFIGAFVIFEKLTGKTKWYQAIPSSMKWLSTFLVIMFSWVLFRSNDLGTAARYFLAMSGADAYVNSAYGIRYFMDNGTLLALAAAILLCLPVPESWRNWAGTSRAGAVVINTSALLSLAAALLFMVNSTYNAFIYFQF